MQLRFVSLWLVAFLFSGGILYAQEKAPLLSGRINVSIKEGTFDCDLTLSDIPRIEDYYIMLNSGMNLLHFKNTAQNSLYYYEKDSKAGVSYESNAYYFPDNTGEAKFLPATFTMKYTGKYPVIKDTLENYALQDWKGNIAFNGYSVRTDGMQTAWYPIIYDIEKDKKYTAVRYDIEINCIDCSTLYINGSKAVEATSHQFKSELAQELTMFLGNYKTANVKGTYILNPDITEQQIQAFGDLMASFKAYYEKKLSIPYKQDITFIQTTPVSKRNSWLFVTYPTIMIIGHGDKGLSGMFNEKDGDFYKPFLAHELGHYYFSFYKSFNSPLGDMMTEGFAEYMSLKATQELLGEKLYQAKLEQKFNSFKNFTPVSFSKVQSNDDYKNRNTYVYNYAPIIFLAIEKEIGEKKMWKWLNTLLQTSTTFTDYEFLISTLKKTISNERIFQRIESEYLNNDLSHENAVKRIKQ